MTEDKRINITVDDLSDQRIYTTKEKLAKISESIAPPVTDKTPKRKKKEIKNVSPSAEKTSNVAPSSPPAPPAPALVIPKVEEEAPKAVSNVQPATTAKDSSNKESNILKAIVEGFKNQKETTSTSTVARDTVAKMLGVPSVKSIQDIMNESKDESKEKSSKIVEGILTTLLSEVKVIRKIVEGRISYSPKTNRYQDLSNKGRFTKDHLVREEKAPKKPELKSYSKGAKVIVPDMNKTVNTGSNIISMILKNPANIIRSETSSFPTAFPSTVAEKSDVANKVAADELKPTDNKSDTNIDIDLTRNKTTQNIPKKESKIRGIGRKMMGILRSPAGRIVGGVGGAAVGGLLAYSSWNDAKKTAEEKQKDLTQALEAGEISKEEYDLQIKKIQKEESGGKGEAIGSGIGTGVGAIAGSLLGPVGTVAGGYVGSKIGGWVGEKIGRSGGVKIVPPSEATNNYHSARTADVIPKKLTEGTGDGISRLSTENSQMIRETAQPAPSTPIVSNSVISNNTQSILPVKATPRMESTFTRLQERNSVYN
jgi:hypothetical protein